MELASLGAYVVVLRGKFTLAVSLDGRLFPMLCETLLMLAGLALRSSPSPAGSPFLKIPESNSLSPTIWHAGTNFL